ncbi:MAG: hypothetical protein OHK0026_10350 [Rhodocyclaceae bacterium]
MQAQGYVERIEGALAVVELDAAGAGCGRCSERGGCGSQLLTRPFGTRCTRLRVSNTIGARAGERVVLELAESSLVRAALAVYLLPVVFVVAGAAGGVALGEGDTDVPALVGALIGFAASLAAVMAFHRRASSDPRYRPVLRRPDVH